MNLTRGFVTALRATPLGGKARDEAGRLVMDGLAVAALGAGQPGPTLLARQAVAATAPAPSATLIGHDRQTEPAAAARANGAAMHVLDFEPMWNPATHSLSTVLPALLALAEAGYVPAVDRPLGERLLDALSTGVEAQGRLRLASRQFEPKDLAFHPPGIVGPIGSAAACGLLIGLDHDQMVHAIGIAASRAGGILINVGSMTKALHCGQAAASGLEAALLAAAGFTADSDPLAGPRGFCTAFFGPEFDETQLIRDDAAPQIVTPGPAYKLYPSQYGTHFVIEASLAARAQHRDGHRPTDVVIHCPPMPYVDRPAPASGLAGKFSFQYVSAAALLDGKVTIASFSDQRRFATDLDCLLPRVHIRPDPTREGRFDRMRVDVEVRWDDGQVTLGHCDGPPGIWGRPVRQEQLRTKALDCLVEALGSQDAAGVVSQCDGFGTLDHARLSALMRVLGRSSGHGKAA